ncbi:hypothetical protein BGX21_001710 [Mortierella sp. AD011]|nr:hypothetical protein BGX21_001710 [Mortierella sp. AD011]
MFAKERQVEYAHSTSLQLRIYRRLFGGSSTKDLSEGSEELNDFGNRMATSHSEALLFPYVNSEAVGDVYSFGDLWRINNKVYHSRAKRDLLPNCWEFIIEKAEAELEDIEYEERQDETHGYYYDEEDDWYSGSEEDWDYQSDSNSDYNSDSDSDSDPDYYDSGYW